MTKRKDPIWNTIRTEVEEDIRREPLLASFLYAVVLNHKTLEDVLSFQLASKLGSSTLTEVSLRDLIDEAFAGDPGIGAAFRADILAVRTRDPACTKYSTPLLHFKGFQAIQAHRVAHYYWTHGREPLALFMQSRISEVFGVDIHPGAKLGRGILMDHATGVVIGETAVVGDNVSLLHHVTLGGTGKELGDRHPKVGNGVLISVGASILGNVRIGDGAKIAAHAVVLSDVPAHSTFAGVPARMVGRPHDKQPALEMDHSITEPDAE
ncbi:MAG TPA: serine O-acetyltransferase [Candidatus Hydrogenedentes bacterium]|nr:serine O-acetyltransferase [Candidatus Hydrogenedentota bacterium]HPG70160.1 serine O-acetyltransferase [Candidatus Hydrogenedentota bacterium]